jgi:hypothetical protein
LGGEANGGTGSPLLDVTHVVLDQPGGSAGATTVSKNWTKSRTRLQLGASWSGLPWPLKTDVGAVASATTAAATKEIKQRTVQDILDSSSSRMCLASASIRQYRLFPQKSDHFSNRPNVIANARFRRWQMSVNEFSFVTELFGIRLNVHCPGESPIQVP